MLKIEIDGKSVEVDHGTTIIDAADQLGIAIPRFCYHKKLSVAANCRMCLVQVEKFNKPLPACATPVADGMKIYTRSKAAEEAQKSVMEFLLINHPLDCPICDQGGECDLQDIAVAYGASGSRYQEEKRVVLNKNIGPLISTDMTRCIQCTRCVRFLKEVGGMMELGLINRGEHAEITAYVDKSVDSELSGNIIDLCPVGALTNKPFRYSARSWELTRRPAIAAHDGLGSQIEVHVKDNRVMRVLPREKESINECWLSDRDRYSYEGLNSSERLTKPMIRRGKIYEEVDWQTALEFTVAKLRGIVQQDPNQLGVLLKTNCTMEEGYLAKKLTKGLACGNIDHRLRRSDYRLDGRFHGSSWMGCNISDVDQMDRFLIVGSNLRNEHPLLAHRVRTAVKNGARMTLVNPMDDDQLIPAFHKVITSMDDMVFALAKILKAVSGLQRLSLCLPKSLNDLLSSIEVDAQSQEIAETLAGLGKDFDLVSPKSVVWLGNIAQHHQRYSELYSLCEAIASLCGATFGVLSEGANRVGLDLARVLPSRGALNAKTMFEEPRKAYLLMNVEPELDCANPALAQAALKQAEFVVALTPFKSEALAQADVLLPIAPFTETSGTFMSMEGRVQSFAACVRPLGETRPGWKVLRVLANMLGVNGFDYESSEQVKDEIFGGEKPSKVVWNRLNNNLTQLSEVTIANKIKKLQRLGEVPAFMVDNVVRRAASLQKTKKAQQVFASMHPNLMKKLKLQAGDLALVSQGNQSAKLPVQPDNGLPENTVRVPAGRPETVMLGDMMGEIEVSKA